MDKLISVLLAGSAIFLTVGTLSTASSTASGSRRSWGTGAPLVAEHANSSSPTEAAQTNEAAKPEIERGRYLVEEVAKCPECHTPRNDRGELRHDAWLSGAAIWIRPVAPIPNWADHVPAIAGWPSFTEAQG